MKPLIWSPEAADEFAAAIDYIAHTDPAAAARVARRIWEAASSLELFPLKGRIGRVAGTRELPIASLPYIVVYEVLDERVRLLRIVHGARLWTM